MTAVILSMPSNDFYSWPYMIAIVIVLIAFAASLFVFRSLRNFRRKRNILIFGVFFLILGLLMFQSVDVTRRAIVNYSFNTNYDKAYPGEVNWCVWACSNFGGRSADFYLVVNAVNASFIIQDQKDYVLEGNATVKVPFSLNQNSDSKTIYYRVNDEADSFSFSTSVQNKASAGLDVAYGFSSLTFVWNATQNLYVLKYASGFTV